jgi:hypothetical protein
MHTQLCRLDDAHSALAPARPLRKVPHSLGLRAKKDLKRGSDQNLGFRV